MAKIFAICKSKKSPGRRRSIPIARNNSSVWVISLIGVGMLIYFLFSPVLCFPSEPKFGRLLLNKPSIMIEGESWVPIYGAQLVLEVSALYSYIATFAVGFAFVLIIVMFPFVDFLRSRMLLNALGMTVAICFIYICVAFAMYYSYSDKVAFLLALGSLVVLSKALVIRFGNVQAQESDKCIV